MSALGVNVTLDQAALGQLGGILGANSKAYRRQVGIAINETLGDVKAYIAKRITETVRIAQYKVRAQLRVRKVGSGSISSGVVSLSASRRLELKEFGARQVGLRKGRKLRRNEKGQFMRRGVNPLAGVTYQIARTGGRKLLPQGFQIEQFESQVFVRKGDAPRLPIRKVLGVSPWGVAVKGGQVPDYGAHAKKRLDYRLARRVRLAGLRAAGVVGGTS